MSNDDLTTKLAGALREAVQSLETIAKNAGKRLDSEGQENMLAHHDQVRGYATSRAGAAREALRLYDAAKAQPKQAAEPAILNCEIQPRPLSHPLADYHHAMSEGPLHYTWQDKPHRLVYDLIAAVRFYAAPMAQTEPRKPLTHAQIDAIWNSVEWSPRLHIEITRAIEAAHNIGNE